MPKVSTVTIKGTDANDVLTVPAGRTLSNTSFDGGRGNDVLNLSNYASDGVRVLLNSGTAKAASAVWEEAFTGAFSTGVASAAKISGSLKNIESVIGTAGDDQITLFTPTTPAKFADGGAGDDSINPRGGLGIGGTGSDWLVSYLAGNVLVGGTYANGVATPDDVKDQYYINSAPLILDFEVGIDKLIFERDASQTAAFGNATWQTNGSGGSQLMVNGTVAVTLATVAPEDAGEIEWGFALGAVNGVLSGSAGDDMLFSSANSERILLGANTGHDMIVDFTLNDVIVFEDGLTPTWSDTIINGQAALVGTFGDNSITLEGYTTAAVGSLNIEGYSGPDEYGTAGSSVWSVPSDADYFP